MAHLLDGGRTHEPVLDTTEIWESSSTTDDTHPIHLHLVRFQFPDSRPFDTPAFVLLKLFPQSHELGVSCSFRSSETAFAGTSTAESASS